MTKPSQEIKRIEQLLADPWAADIEKHKLVKNAGSYLSITAKDMFKYWYNDVNVQKAN